MYINLKQTLTQIERCLSDAGALDSRQLCRMYDLTLRLQSQVLAVIHDLEAFSPQPGKESLAAAHSAGYNVSGDAAGTAAFHETAD